jgi:hypothetical protein
MTHFRLYSILWTPALTLISRLFSIAALLSVSIAHADKLSNLKVIQEAAQTGKWTTLLSGTMADGSPVPKKTETVCATKEEVLALYDQAIYTNTLTGVENTSCPTILTVNTPTRGVATMTCPGQTINMGDKEMKIPGFTAVTEFKRINNDTWTTTFGTMVSTAKFHGAATAACVATR